MKVEIKDHELEAIRRLIEYVPAMVITVDLTHTDPGRKVLSWISALRELTARIDDA
jgi:hypothetical protein